MGIGASVGAELHHINITAAWLLPEELYGTNPLFEKWQHEAPVSQVGNASRLGKNGTCGGKGGGLRFSPGRCEPPK